MKGDLKRWKSADGLRHPGPNVPSSRKVSLRLQFREIPLADLAKWAGPGISKFHELDSC